MEEIESNIRACIQSTKSQIPIRDLARDYETLVGDPIPYRQFNYATLEDFLRDLRSLRIQSVNGQAVVQAISSEESGHIRELICKQKSSKKLAPRKSYPPTFRGRGGSRGRGRGTYTRPYVPYRGQDGYYPRDYTSGGYASKNQRANFNPRARASGVQRTNYNSRDGASGDQYANDYDSRAHVSGDKRDRGDYDTRGSASGDQRDRDYDSWGRSSGEQSYNDYNDTNSMAKRDTSNLHNRLSNTQPGGPLTVKVHGNDRQVSWKKPEIAPRFARSRQQNAEASSPLPPASSPGAEGFDTSLFKDQSNSDSNSASIISPMGPSQLVAKALAKKEEEEQAKREQQYLGTSDLLLQSSPYEANDLATEFASLSYRDSNVVTFGNHILLNEQNQNNLASDFARLSHQGSVTFGNHTSLVGQSQMPERVSLLPIQQPDDPLPVPDEEVLPNNVDALRRFCVSCGWPEPTYSVLNRKDRLTRQSIFFASITVNGGDDKTFKVNSLPFEHTDINMVKGEAARLAFKQILAVQAKKVKADKVISSDSKTICSRISDIVADTAGGLFISSVEDQYISRHNELLPQDWLQSVRSWPTLSVEKTSHSTIIVPRLPVLQFDKTVAPPPLPVEALGDEDNQEYVHITHATSVNNVWFRVIGPDYSDEYDNLLKNMDTYYNGDGSKDLAVSLEVGQYYAARLDDTWFRVCVTEVHDDAQTVVAWLVDLGGHERFTFNSLFWLAPQFCQLPRQAMMCVLEGLECFNDDELANEVVSSSSLLIGQSLVANIVAKDGELSFVKATLYDTSGDDDINVNQRIEDEIIAKAKPVLPAVGLASEVIIGHVSKKGEVYVMFNGPALERITETLESLGSDAIAEHKLTSFKHISLNKMYLAKYSKDDTWYRAVVTTPPSMQLNKIHVQFVDYGNTESVTISDVADLENLPPLLKKLPPQAMKVALHNLPVESLNNPEVARLHSLLLAEEKSILVKTISLSSELELPVVEIYTKDSEEAPLVSVNSSIELRRKLYKNSFGSDAMVNPLLHSQDNFVLPCPNLTDDNKEYQGILVVLTAHPGNFIFQPVKYSKELKKLRVEMAAYYDAGSIPELPVSRVVKSKLFAAQYNDHMWYRVVVTEAPMGSRVPVRLCDYGDVTCVSVSSLRELAPEFLIYPFLAVKGKLAGVAPINKDWSVEDCIRFQELVVDKILAGRVCKVDNNPSNPMDMVITMDLWDTNTDTDRNIGQILVQEERAVKQS